MKIDEHKQGAVTIIRPGGALVGEDAQVFADRLASSCASAAGRLAIDCGRVAYVDSVGLESLVDAAEALSVTGHTMRLVTVNETVREAMEITGVAGRFEFFADVNSAIRSYL